MQLDTVENDIVKELSQSGQEMIEKLPLLQNIEKHVEGLVEEVESINEQVAALVSEANSKKSELDGLVQELEQVTEMIKLAHSVKQLLISKSTAKAYMDEGDFQNAAAFLGNILTDSDKLSSFTTCNELYKELSEMSIAVQKLLANSAKPRN